MSNANRWFRVMQSNVSGILKYYSGAFLLLVRTMHKRQAFGEIKEAFL
jgi:hypothetical protein